MTHVSVLGASIAHVATVTPGLSDVAAQPAASAISPWTLLFAAIATALLLYRSTVGVARRNLLVGTVTTERAKWRTDLRRSVANLVSIANAMAPNPSRKDIAAFDKVRVEVRLRLNLSLKPEDVLDQRILAALKDLRTALVEGEQVRINDQIEAIESGAQLLLKQEWGKSKEEARTGVLQIAGNKRLLGFRIGLVWM